MDVVTEGKDMKVLTMDALLATFRLMKYIKTKTLQKRR